MEKEQQERFKQAVERKAREAEADSHTAQPGGPDQPGPTEEKVRLAGTGGDEGKRSST